MNFWPVNKTLICRPSFWAAIVDELSEPIKYQSAADKRAAQMVVFGIDEMVRKFLKQTLERPRIRTIVRGISEVQFGVQN